VIDKYMASAVTAFEKWEGLARNGVIGPAVWAKLQTATRPTPTETSPGTNPWIEVDKTKQVLLYCKDGAVVWTLHVSTGSASVGMASPSGTWPILRKYAGSTSDKMYWPMYYWHGSPTDLAIHGFSNVPTYAASHGCVRTETWDQDALYPLISVGMYLYIYDDPAPTS
jgi:lipoprotein-anchoring transpeptidase ErfK/SrfK